MSPRDEAAADHDADNGVECWNCGGEGFVVMCPESSCPALYGEEGCDDPACARVCPICRGGGGL